MLAFLVSTNFIPISIWIMNGVHGYAWFSRF